MQWANRKQGFTIVELLVVIVVVAILAAITIVAYSNIKTLAVDATLKSDSESAAKVLANDLTLNGVYPVTAAAANNGKGLPRSGANAYLYIPNNSANPPTYTLTISNPGSANSYVVTESSNIPTLITGAAPVVTTPTADTVTVTGGCGAGYYNFDLFATATGSPAPTIQWQRMSPKNTTAGTWSDITGGTTNFYTHVDNTLIEGEYRVFRAIFTSGAFTSTTPTLQITLENGC
jgi:prepilin-type N-terminal cleavage/methylation domain-containing protein